MKKGNHTPNSAWYLTDVIVPNYSEKFKALWQRRRRMQGSAASGGCRHLLVKPQSDQVDNI